MAGQNEKELSTQDETAAKTARALLPLYRESEDDFPECVHAQGPNAPSIIRAQRLLIDVLLPGRNAKAVRSGQPFQLYLERMLQRAREILQPEVEKAIPFRWLGRAASEEGPPQALDAHAESMAIISAFYGAIPSIRRSLLEDIKAAYDGDPAALTYVEVKLAYPGLLAIASHRIAHELYLLSVPIVPRVMSEWTHTMTGVDIHPGARIGHGFFIDHGTGVVIGETAEIGNNVKLYQGVTLGARSFPLDEHGRPIKHIKRHPTVEDGVIVYSNATILGGDTIIGAGSTVGGNVFLMESVPAGSFVVSQAPQPRIKTENNK